MYSNKKGTKKAIIYQLCIIICQFMEVDNYTRGAFQLEHKTHSFLLFLRLFGSFAVDLPHQVIEDLQYDHPRLNTCTL